MADEEVEVKSAAARTDFHRVKLRSPVEGKPTTGANVQVLLDGQPLRGARSLRIEVVARRLAVVTLEMYARVEADLLADVDVVEVPVVGSPAREPVPATERICPNDPACGRDCTPFDCESRDL